MDSFKFIRRIKIVFVVLFFVCLVSVGTLLCVVKRNTSYLEDEKRVPTQFPPLSWHTVICGDYTEQLRMYYNDTIPFRSEFKRFSDQILLYKGFNIDEFYIDIPNNIPMLDPDTEPTFFPETSPDASDDGNIDLPQNTISPTKNPTNDKPNVNDFYENQGIVTYQKRAMELYWGSKAKMQVYAAALNRLQAKCPTINVWSMNIPVSSAFYLPASLAGKYGDQKADCAYIEQLLNDQINFVDVYGVLSKHIDEPIYLRTDHHWSYLGAYYAVKQFMSQTGLPVPNLSKDYTKKTEDGILGSFYLYFDQKHLVQWPETFDWYEPTCSYKGEYFDYSSMQVVKKETNQMFFYYSKPFYDMVNYGDSYLAHITTENKTGRRIVVFKDSFGNAIAPFLVTGFEEIWVVDIRYFQGDAYDFIEENEITDVLMASCLFTNAGNKVSYYHNIFNR